MCSLQIWMELYNITLPLFIFPHATYSPPCSSFKCESIKHYKLPSASHMVSDSSACGREGRVPDTHSNVLQWDNSPAVPTGGQCNSTHGGHCAWNGVPSDCVSLQPGWNQYNCPSPILYTSWRWVLPLLNNRCIVNFGWGVMVIPGHFDWPPYNWTGHHVTGSHVFHNHLFNFQRNCGLGNLSADGWFYVACSCCTPLYYHPVGWKRVYK